MWGSTGNSPLPIMPPTPPHDLVISGIQIGSGTLLVPFASLYALFAPVGYTERQFENLLSAMGIAWLQAPTGKLINFFKFVLAIEVSTMNGELPLNLHEDHLPYHGAARQSVTREDYERLWERAVSELLMVRKFPGLMNPPAIREALDGAARSIISQVARATAAHHDFVAHRALNDPETLQTINPPEVDPVPPDTFTKPRPPLPPTDVAKSAPLTPVPPLTYTDPSVTVHNPPPPHVPP